jgi:cytochrome c peroxidase
MKRSVSSETTADRGINLCVASLRRGIAAVALCFLSHAGSAATVELVMNHVIAGERLQLGALRYATSANESFSITRLSYLLSEFAFQREDGSWLQLTNSVVWFDAEKERALTQLTTPSGSYRAVSFVVGLETHLNHADPAKFRADHPLNPNLNGLHWSWQGGYVFVALEGRWQNATTVAVAPLDGFSYHLARDTNRTPIVLAIGLDLTSDARVELDFDPGSLLHAPRALSFANDGSTTHSRDGDPIAAALVANLPNAFRVRKVGKSEVEVSATPIARKPLHMPEKFTPYQFTMSATFPVPDLPRDNPLSAERVALGERLFHEPLLSRDGTLSCASCHARSTAFSDARQFSIGVSNRVGTRHAMPLFNLAWKQSFFWDGRAPSLRAQALMPIQDHAEMDESLTNVIAKLEGRAGCPQPAASDDAPLPRGEDAAPYHELFTRAFGSSEITAEKIGLALEQFLLTLTSFDSKFDRAARGESELSTDEKRGLELFMTEHDPRRGQLGADCFHCHGGPLFHSQAFANNGLDTNFKDKGREKVTGRNADEGKFATPSLRNIALTAPYMHDGRFRTLEEVVEHYSTGVKRSATLDPNLAKHPAGGLHLSSEEQRALVAFLRTLTDEKFSAGSGAVARR